MRKLKLSTDQFIERAKSIHGNNLVFDKSIYTGIRDNILVTCPEHGDFTKLPSGIFAGQGCPVCSGYLKELPVLKISDIDLKENERAILLSQNKYTIVDLDDYEWLAKRKWWLKTGRGGMYVWGPGDSDSTGMTGRIWMHRVIMHVSDPALVVDHINGNTLDNRKINLRVCEQYQNCKNTSKRKNGISRYKGVSIKVLKNSVKWSAEIQSDGKSYYIGLFDTQELAAEAYNRYAIKYHGEFAKLNII